MKRFTVWALTMLIVGSLVLAGFGCKSAASTTTSTTTSTKVNTTTSATSTVIPSTTSTSTVSKPPAQPIKIGILESMSGSYAIYGQAYKQGALAAIQMVNDAGGIKSLGGAKLVPVIGVGDSTVPTATSEMERLINVEHVAAIVGPSGTAETLGVAPLAERYQIPIIGSPVSDDLFSHGYQYVFSTAVPPVIYGDREAEFVDYLVKTYGAPTDRIGILTTTPSYTSHSNELVSKLKALGYGNAIVANESFPSSLVDMSSLVLKLKAANVSLIVYNGTVPGNTSFYQATYTYQYHPWLITIASGFGTPLRNSLSPAIANAELPRPNHFQVGATIFSGGYNTIPSLKAFYDLNQKLNPDSKVQYVDVVNGGAQPLLAVARAIDNAGSSNPTDIANALRKLVIKGPDPYLVFASQYPTLQMSSTGIANSGTVMVAQWSDDLSTIDTVWPPEMASVKPRVQK